MLNVGNKVITRPAAGCPGVVGEIVFISHDGICLLSNGVSYKDVLLKLYIEPILGRKVMDGYGNFGIITEVQIHSVTRAILIRTNDEGPLRYWSRFDYVGSLKKPTLEYGPE